MTVSHGYTFVYPKMPPPALTPVPPKAPVPPNAPVLPKAPVAPLTVPSPGAMRVVNELPLLALVAILWLVLLKPF